MALTDNDVTKIESAVRGIITLEVKPEIDDLKERIKGLPTRNEFLDLISEVMGELKITRDEQTILDGRTSEHTRQIEKLEKIHPQGQHSTA